MAPSQNSDKYAGPLLKSPESFRKWFAAINKGIRYQDVYLVASGAERRPEIPVNERGKEVTKEDIEKAEELQRQWDRRNPKAVGVIFRTLSNKITQEYTHYDNAYQVLATLKEKYDTISNVQSFHGLQMACNTRYDECKGMNDYISRLKLALERYERGLWKNSVLDDSMKIQFIFMNLGEEWNTFLTSYINSSYDREKTTFDEVSRSLVEEELRVKYNAEAANLVKAQKGKDASKKNSKGSKKNDSKDDKDFKGPTCPTCKKKGHTEDKCWFRHPELRPDSWKDKKRNRDRDYDQNHKYDREESAKHLDAFICAAQVADESIIFDLERARYLRKDDWIIDSGATCHLTSDENNFIEGSMKPLRKAIRTATGHVAHSTLSGDVEITLQHPDRQQKLILADVLYLPDIKINLFGTIKFNRRGLGINLLPNEIIISRVVDGEIIGYGDIKNETYIMRIARNDSFQVSKDPVSTDEYREFLTGSDNETTLNTAQPTRPRVAKYHAKYYTTLKARNMRKD
ncbi:uncharacterized protein KD926_010786 [Aspergillus affinis]|uniref:uncharacterized protein n=1 Tax=Aspergillus affinis TaxID=1070780 RepID=UPI0022FDF80C|nr:uncharacterized protein KD926_010786 [Aspergillus affinis]KAI9038474.1 hypothetical protein KD926_010786 [Aspergillus affinis]